MMQSGRVIGTGKVNAVINSGEQLIVDSSPLTLEMSRRDRNEELICDEYQTEIFDRSISPSSDRRKRIDFFARRERILKVIIEVNEIAETV